MHFNVFCFYSKPKVFPGLSNHSKGQNIPSETLKTVILEKIGFFKTLTQLICFEQCLL